MAIINSWGGKIVRLWVMELWRERRGVRHRLTYLTEHPRTVFYATENSRGSHRGECHAKSHSFVTVVKLNEVSSG